jgi:universal stress protein A
MELGDLQTTLLERARATALDYASRFALPEAQVHVELGAIERTIQAKADALEADVIVVGCHTRSGLALLLGSTARGLVPGAKCDVLAVKVDG